MVRWESERIAYVIGVFWIATNGDAEREAAGVGLVGGDGIEEESGGDIVSGGKNLVIREGVDVVVAVDETQDYGTVNERGFFTVDVSHAPLLQDYCSTDARNGMQLTSMENRTVFIDEQVPTDVPELRECGT